MILMNIKKIPEVISLPDEERDRVIKESQIRLRRKYAIRNGFLLFFLILIANILSDIILDSPSFFTELAFESAIGLPVYIILSSIMKTSMIRKDISSYKELNT